MWRDTSYKCAGKTGPLFRYGPDRPITAASVDAVQRERAKRSTQPLSSEQLIREFVAFPTARHLARVERVLASLRRGQRTGSASPSPA